MAVGAIVVLLIVIGIVGAAVDGSHPSSSNDASATTNPAVQTNGGSGSNGSGQPTSTSHQVLVDHQGSGQWTSPKFTGPTDWTIEYAYDCSNFGQSGNFMVSVEGGDNGFSTSGVNELKLKGSGSTSVHDASGPGVYLAVDSECNWHVKAVS